PPRSPTGYRPRPACPSTTPTARAHYATDVDTPEYRPSVAGFRSPYSNKRLLEAAEARGHDIQVVHTLRCYMDIASHDPSVHLGGRELPFFDAVIPRIGASVTFYGCAVLRQFEMMGSYPLNESV